MESVNNSQPVLLSGNTQNISARQSITTGAENSPGDITKSASEQPSSTASSDSISLSKSVVVEQIVTQQVEVALQINTSDRQRLPVANRTPLNDLIGKVSAKIDDDVSARNAMDSNHESLENHHATVVKDVNVRVEQGIQKATTILNQLGVMDESTQEQVSRARQQMSAAVEKSIAQLALQSNDVAVETAVASGVEGTRKLKSALQVATSDGDIVTIELSRSQLASVGYAESENAIAAFADHTSSSQLSVAVQGDLNKKESEAIREVVKRVNRMAEKLFNGKIEAAMEKMNELNIDSRQLASMSLSMSSSITYTAVNAYAEVSSIPLESGVSDSVLGADSNPAEESVVSSGVNQDVQLSRQQSQSLSVEISAVDVTREIAEEASEIVDSDVFENPFRDIRRLFASIADSFQQANSYRVSDNHHSYIKELFDNVLEVVHDSEIDDHEREHSANASVLIQYA